MAPQRFSRREPNNVLLELVAAAPDALLVVAHDGTITFANERTAQLFGWESDELVGRPVEELVPCEIAGRHRHLRMSYASKPSPRQMGDGRPLRSRRRDGTEFAAEIGLNVASDGSTVVAVRDVTARVAAEAERERIAEEARQERTNAMTSLGELAGGVAHDVDNVLGAILNFVTLIERRDDLADDLRDDLRQIRLAAERGSWLTDQLVHFAHPDHGPADLIHLGDVVATGADVVRRTLPDEIDLEVVTTGGDAMIWASEHAVVQILVNLVNNARDAMPCGGRLTIRCDAHTDDDAPAAILTVADTGTGVRPDVADRVFEPFVTTKARRDGTGLGLAIVRRLATSLGGDVQLTSAPGEGTTVAVTVPIGTERS